MDFKLTVELMMKNSKICKTIFGANVRRECRRRILVSRLYLLRVCLPRKRIFHDFFSSFHLFFFFRIFFFHIFYELTYAAGIPGIRGHGWNVL